MFINIRGTFGSGKTTVVRKLMEELLRRGALDEPMIEPVERLANKNKFMGHRFAPITGLQKPVVFIGKYGHVACGGADGLSWKGAHEDIEAFIKRNIDTCHIVLEGSITSGGSRYNRIGTELKAQGINSIYFHMATPKEVCVERVISRRQKKFEENKIKAEAKGKIAEPRKPFDRANLDKLFIVCDKQEQKTLALGHTLIKIESNDEVGKYIVNLLKEDETSHGDSREHTSNPST